MKTFDFLKEKICSWEELKASVSNWQAQGQRVVFTNGCFDILHYGHIHYLAEASDLGDRLVIGLNASESVSRLKGSNRPINDDLTRSFQLAAFGFIDGLTFFPQDTPLELIRLLSPDILVKGGDWKPEQIVGSNWVLAQGGQVKSLPYIDGYSTTNIETKIKNMGK
ncbi:MAG: adenylyltransferase/cytidyltransferase family protein [Saprospiraceae bacterium]|nr:adenylyltransferase/cytidyltransferase family protein [Saprospiraceae bacterium]